MNYGTRASVEKSNEKVVISDRIIEHHTNDTEAVLNIVSQDRRVGKVARAFVQPEVHEYMFHLKKVPGFKELKPIKHNIFSKVFKNIRNLLVS